MSGQILVVDDDRLVLATVTHGLQQAGFTVLDADNGDDAILLAHQHRPDLALLDIRMEGKTGFDVAAYLRDGPGIPFMFLSAFSDAKSRQQATELGAVDYLVKPLDVAQIVPRVRAVMAQLKHGPATVPVAPAARPDAVLNPDHAVPLAVGALMHRHSLNRQQALKRLEEMAQAQQVKLVVQANRLLDALEELARS